jgi:hypothetical protein
VAQIRGRPLSPAAADNSHPSRTVMCMIVMTADIVFSFSYKEEKERYYEYDGVVGRRALYRRLCHCPR